MRYDRTTLPNGLRILVSEMPETRSVSLAVYVGVGSRVEDRTNAGTAHFLEHILFKGTAKRPAAQDISHAIEGVGGTVNASTDKEVTVFWSRMVARHYLLALDVIADMIRAPLLRPDDVDQERKVVLEELRMYRDQPSDRVHALIDELLYPGHPLGWETAGRESVVTALTPEALRGFMDRGYAPERTIVALAGRLDAQEAIGAVTAHFGDMAPRAAIRTRPAPASGRVRTKHVAKRGEQAHLCIGWRGAPQAHPDKYTLDMLNAILGEGMSSRLFQELREKSALAYDVHSYGTNYADAGHLVVYAGVAPARAGEALARAHEQVARLRDEPVGEAELLRVRDFVKGRIELRLEDTRGVSGWLAGQEMFLGRVRSVEELCAIIDAIGPADIQRVARQYLRADLAYVAAVGPRAALVTLAPEAEIVMEKAS
jgi:predicted Zn-dependent peptidase